MLLALALSTLLAQVETIDVTMKDEKRGKELALRLHVKKGDAKGPLLLFSHGFGASQEAFEETSRHWAEHGYVTIRPRHRDSGELRKGGIDAARKGINEPAAWDERVGDLVHILDSMEAIAAKVPALRGRYDLDRVGVGGHSFGAFTTMLIGGTTVEQDGKARSFADKRVKALLPISAQGTGQQGLTKSSWENVKLPMLTMTGTRDRGIGGQTPEWRGEPFKYAPAGDKYHVVIDGATHVAFDDGEAAITDCVKKLTLAFWDAYLKGDADAKAKLASGGKAVVTSK